jgi:hypothetical protein
LSEGSQALLALLSHKSSVEVKSLAWWRGGRCCVSLIL